MEIVGIVLGVFALLAALGIYIKNWAAKSLLPDSEMKPLKDPISDGRESFWAVELTFKKGNLVRRLLGDIATKEVYADVKFEGIDETSGTYNSKAYDVIYGVGDRKVPFDIIGCSTVKLIVVKRRRNLTLGDSFGRSQLKGSYNLHLFLKDQRQNTLKEYIIDSYIVDGKPNVDGWKP